MENMNLIRKIKEVDPEEFNRLYEELVVKKIRAKYSNNAELAILRQRDTKPEEFAAYNAYVEECKAEAKAELEI